MESPAGKLGHTASATELVLSRLAEDRQRLIDLFLAQRARLHQTLGQIEDWLADIAGQFHAVELSIRRRHFELAVRSQELERRERIVAELTHKLYCRLKDWELLQDRLRLEQEALSGQLRDAESTLARAVSQLEDQFHNWNRVKTDLASRIDQAWNVAQRLGQEEGRLASWEHELALRENALADREKLLAFREARTESQRRLLVHRLRTQRHARKAQNPGGEIALDSAAWQDFLRRWEAFVAEQQRVRALLEQLAQAGLGSWAGSNSGVGVEASPEGLSDRFSEQPDSGSSGRDVVCPRKLEGVPTSDSRPPEVVDLDPKSSPPEGEH
ncbi:MAG: hypothetical protein NZ899_07025, partial [Thermoguttaceae bacterium]|nr:hypothetical protein [Thermoguttaceae bacterium]